MKNDSPPDIDRRVRDAFAASPETVARVVGGAMADRAPRRRRGWVPGLVATAAVVVIATAVALWPTRPEPTPPESTFLSGSFTDGVLVVSLPDGSVSISGDASREDRPPDGCGIVVVEGGVR
jgi:hypothetical protein